MSPTVLYIVALILAAIDQLQAEGRSLVTWAVIVVCLGLLWGVIKL